MSLNHQLSLFEQRLPSKPYCTEHFADGVAIRQAKSAIKRAYIQPNQPVMRYWLVFDLDYAGAAIEWQTMSVPAPNITATNPANGYAHLFYALEVPVCTSPKGSSKALRYAAAIERSLGDALNADPQYCGLLAKNPLHPRWFVQTWQQQCYTLDWLADYLDLSACSGSARLNPVGLGRNCNLFDYLREWAYKAIRQGWPDYDQWLDACLTRAEGYNAKQHAHDPLQYSEVKATAKSVAKWVYRNFSPSAFSAWQAAQGAKGGKVSKGGGRPSLKEPWLELGISRATYFRKKKNDTL